MASLPAYRRTLEDVASRLRWSRNSPVLRFAALTLAAVPGRDPGADLYRTAASLRKKAGFWSSLNSPLRFVFAALILRRGLDPLAVHDAMERAVEGLRSRGLGRFGLFRRLAALVLVFRHGPDVPAAVLDRMAAIHAAWVRDHWWLTNDADFPMAALHASRAEPVAALTARLEDIYRRLVAARFGRGNALQLASHILGVEEWDARRAATRFADVAEALKSCRIPVGRDRYDEIALLALTGRDPGRLAGEIAGHVAVLKKDLGWWNPGLAFPLAAGCVLAGDGRVRDAHEVALTKEVHDILAAEAAAAACISF